MKGPCKRIIALGGMAAVLTLYAVVAAGGLWMWRDDLVHPTCFPFQSLLAAAVLLPMPFQLLSAGWVFFRLRAGLGDRWSALRWTWLGLLAFLPLGVLASVAGGVASSAIVVVAVSSIETLITVTIFGAAYVGCVVAPFLLLEWLVRRWAAHSALLRGGLR